MFVVKKATTPQELQSILDLRYEILRKPWQQPASTATDGLEANSINAFISDLNGKAIACGRLQENESRVGQVRFMAVDTTYQGKGLGKLIMDFLEEEARKLQLQKVELHARENALAFYKSCGYTLMETSYLLWDQIQHYLMEKEL